MSGGVDSTIAAYLLQQSGYTVRGVHLLLWPPAPYLALVEQTVEVDHGAHQSRLSRPQNTTSMKKSRPGLTSMGA